LPRELGEPSSARQGVWHFSIFFVTRHGPSQSQFRMFVGFSKARCLTLLDFFGIRHALPESLYRTSVASVGANNDSFNELFNLVKFA